MKIAIVHDSRTGRTSAAAEAMKASFEALGHDCTICSVRVAKPEEVAQADLICAGCWTHGLFIILQHPPEDWVSFVERFGDLRGKKVVLFCTYRIAAGRILTKMAKPFEARGAEVIGRFKYRGPVPDKAFARFVETL